jgi:hypothetical protein
MGGWPIGSSGGSDVLRTLVQKAVRGCAWQGDPARGEHVGKPSLRVDVVEFGGGDEAVNR